MTKLKEPPLSIVDIRLDDPALIPGKYFLNHEVIRTLENVIREDVVLKGAKLPRGCHPIYGPLKGSHAEAVARLNVASRGLFRQVMAELPQILLIGTTAAIVFTLISYALGRAL